MVIVSFLAWRDTFWMSSSSNSAILRAWMAVLLSWELVHLGCPMISAKSSHMLDTLCFPITSLSEKQMLVSDCGG